MSEVILKSLDKSILILSVWLRALNSALYFATETCNGPKGLDKIISMASRELNAAKSEGLRRWAIKSWYRRLKKFIKDVPKKTRIIFLPKVSIFLKYLTMLKLKFKLQEAPLPCLKDTFFINYSFRLVYRR